MSDFNHLLKQITPEQGVKLSRTLLQLQYQRQAKQTQDILEGFELVNWQGLQSIWEECFKMCSNPEDAFALFIQHLQGILDGGESPCILESVVS